ncbi:uncharacterized protein LOC112184727 [Rosa chinensis]|uniref:uncharacterized protein LOC112184727 n=1 Tax=Rosa chinensis TaxID=74649 RepID=UPI000D09144F|nr:uncharacterized protein LOC112184727 [Rosa chinensis]
MKELIETYGRASGQLVNFNKSSVVFSKNVTRVMQQEISSFLGVQVVESHEKYLGLPTYVGRKMTTTFQYIKDNLAKKLEVWQGKLLSGAGKDILNRVVAQALPTYAMSIFQLRKTFCEDLEQMCARELLKNSSYWQIGDGEMADIWSNSWIPELRSGKPSRNGTALAAVTKVRDLVGASGF